MRTYFLVWSHILTVQSAPHEANTFWWKGFQRMACTAMWWACGESGVWGVWGLWGCEGVRVCSHGRCLRSDWCRPWSICRWVLPLSPPERDGLQRGWTPRLCQSLGVCARERCDAFLRELWQLVLLSPFLKINRMYCYVQFRVPGSSQCKTRPARALSANLGSLWSNHICYVVYRKWFSRCISCP